MIPLSVLDLSVVTSATKPAAALRNSIDLARHVDGLGYVRYWLAEHHNLASVASPARDEIIGQIAAVTRNIRVEAREEILQPAGGCVRARQEAGGVTSNRPAFP